MAIVTLKHCIAVRIYPRPADNPPETVTTQLTVGGTVGDGVVVAHSGSATGPTVNVTGAGTAGVPFTVPNATEIWLHYMAPPDKPQSVNVDVTMTVS